MTHKQAMKTINEWFGIIGKSDAFSNDRDCEHCVHKKEKGCEVWDCEFEQRGEDNNGKVG